MLIYLNREEILQAVVAHLGTTISIGATDVALGFVNGDVTAVVGVNEALPDDLFEEDDHIEDNDTEQQEDQTSDKPAKQKRRRRRTKAEIEADAAKAKTEQTAEVVESSAPVEPAKAETPDAEKVEAPQQEVEAVAETAPAQPAASEVAAAEEENLFADPTPAARAAEADPEPQGTTANPFGGDDNLFADTADAHVDSPVETEGGFAKPKEDDALNLFS